MRITKSKHSATVVLGPKSVWTDIGTVDHRGLDKERKEVREAAESFCRKHDLTSYSIYASKAHGAYLINQVELAPAD
jgi:hypothetical protein